MTGCLLLENPGGTLRESRGHWPGARGTRQAPLGLFNDMRLDRDPTTPAIDHSVKP
jgi:hypothetical protein